MPEQLDLLSTIDEPADPTHDTVTDALLAAGWTGDPGLLVNRRVMWTLRVNGDSQLTGPGGWTTTFLCGVPTSVVVAACLAAAGAQP